jgi:hypothetical protein
MTTSLTEISEMLTATFGAPIAVSDPDAPAIKDLWVVGQVEVAVADPSPERNQRASWRARQGDRAIPLLVVTEGTTGVRVLGPRADDPVRELSLEALSQTLTDVQGRPRREAAALLADALERRDRTGISGVIIRGLLTKHVLTRRLRKYRPDDWKRLEELAEKVRANRTWLENLTALGYKTEEIKDRSYLLRHDDRPIAVVLPLPDPGAFSRAAANGALPEGLLVADCLREGVEWGLLASEGRFRLFPAKTAIGAATGRYLEIDIAETDVDDWPYIGLLAPECLAEGGLLDELVEDSVNHGNELRDTVEQQIRDEVVPAIARGLAATRPARSASSCSTAPTLGSRVGSELGSTLRQRGRAEEAPRRRAREAGWSRCVILRPSLRCPVRSGSASRSPRARSRSCRSSVVGPRRRTASPPRRSPTGRSRSARSVGDRSRSVSGTRASCRRCWSRANTFRARCRTES